MRMKLVATLIVLGGLATAAAWVPLDGKTLWQRAEQRGLPETTARAMGTAARTVGSAATGVYRWANGAGSSKTPAVRKAGESKAAPATAHAPSSVPSGAARAAAQPPAAARPAAARKVALAPVVPLAPVATLKSDAAPAAVPHAKVSPPEAVAAPAAEAGRDGIVRAAPPEKLSTGDRAALDQLVSRARTGGQ